MRKASLKEASLADKERFVYGGDKATGQADKDTKLQDDIKTDKQELKKTACYLPLDLWVKYKKYEIAKVLQGEKRISFNGLVVKLLTEELKDY